MRSRSFGTGRPTLREAFPKLFRDEHAQNEQQAIPETADTSHDEPAVYHDERAILRTSVLGIPDWKEWEFSYATIALNILVTLLSLDLVFRGPLLYDGKSLTFSRLGFIDDKSAKILFRDPNPANLPIYAYLKPLASSAWSRVDTIYRLSDDTDYTYPIVLSELQPGTEYDYALSNDLRGTFKTAPPRNSLAAKSLTFLTTSCIKANFPYSPFAHSLSIAGLKHMSRVLRSMTSPASFMMFLGDFIYVDVPLRLSSSPEHYRAEYRRVYASPSWDLPGVNLPWLHTLDDHEIANDWAGGNETEPFQAASDPFVNYHVSVNPPFPPKVTPAEEPNTTYFQFTQGPASFFMMDTRRYRTNSEVPAGKLSDNTKPLYGSSSSPAQYRDYGPSMLGPTQLQALLSFLTTPEPLNVHWKFIASSVPFTKNWQFGTSDTWGGFLEERKRILDAMQYAEANLGVRIVILSGDRHEFAAVRFPPTANHTASAGGQSDSTTQGPHEFSVGPLSMFYLPFRTFKQTDKEDVALAYVPDGNSKLGSIEIVPRKADAAGAVRSHLTYTLWVDGVNKWQYTLTSPPSAIRASSNIDTWKVFGSRHG